MSGLFGSSQNNQTTSSTQQQGTQTSAGGVQTTGTNTLVNAPPTGVNPGLLGQFSALLSSGAPGYFGTIGSTASGAFTGGNATGLANSTANSTLQSLLQTGNPTNVGPAWQALIASQNQQATQGAQQIAAAYGSEGLSYGSGLGTALQGYQNQLSSTYANTLAQYTMTAQENAANRQAGAVSTEAGIQQANLLAQLTAATTGAGLESGLAGMFYNPGSTTTTGSSVLTGNTTATQTSGTSSGTSNTQYNSSLFSDIDTLAGALAGIFGAFCWVGRSLWGEHDPRPVILRWWLRRWARRSRLGLFMVKTYIRFGERLARNRVITQVLRPVFNLGLRRAMEELYVAK